METSSDEFEINTIRQLRSINSIGKNWYAGIEVSNVTIKFKLDSGSYLNVLHLNDYNEIQPKPNFKKSNITLEAYGQYSINFSIF